ncbi:tyrosine-type recombinase/integrase [Rhizobium cauense]|uniref:integrase arm-type DNA-binding domain-containing protein n=1 Tax=Rhizobium cauense TaxID=1166683 RepID=UPI001C6EF4D4|nr:integrase arm-type DNA-binding domain-containing protein [Rhizobium cauense]MBW9113854.1 tyrosine-type recombinase/integrase [Rhizobium cauense]
MTRARALDTQRIEKFRLKRNEKRREESDGKTPNLFLRIGRRDKVFELIVRCPGERDPTRLKIGTFPKTTLDRASEVAAEWNAMIERGLDPREEGKRREREALVDARRTFRSAMKDHIAWLPNRTRNCHAAADANCLRAEFLNPKRNDWIDKALADVTKADVGTLIDKIRDRGVPGRAFEALGLIKQFFVWVNAASRYQAYGLPGNVTGNPVADVTPESMQFVRVVRERTLDVVELRAYWRASVAMDYPDGPMYRLVLLTGGRRRDECEGIRWSEIDIGKKLWTIPKDRVKHGNELGDLYVALTDEAAALLEELRRGQPKGWGDCVFSVTNGQTPYTAYDMDDFRARVEEEFRKLMPGSAMDRFWLHDLRRVVRTALSKLGVPKEIAEYVIGHRKKKDYNQDLFIAPCRKAMRQFTDRLLRVLDGSAAGFRADDPDSDE